MTLFNSKMKYETLPAVILIPQTTQNLVILFLVFAKDRKEVYKDL